MNRRDFLLQLSGTIPAVSAFRGFSWDDDEALCKKKFNFAVSLSLRGKPINEVIVAMGKTFLGTDYLAHALEVPGEERLVVNMTGLDCVSFYENALVLARCVKMDRTTFEDYKQQLQLIRYRGGLIDGYLSRLHYTTDYFFDNVKKGVWKDMTGEIGGEPYVKTINFMSTHTESYRQLRENPSLVERIKKMETEVSARKKFYIPKDRVRDIQDKIHSGDILGVTTDIDGLDTSHTGIAVRENDELRLMHAPIAGSKVQITEKTLADYLAGNKRQTGIIVARALEPQT
jgi:hypothetical protein